MLLQLLGGLYLLYLASRIWRTAASAPDLEAPEPRTGTTDAKAFGLALATMLSNPKAAVQYGVIFAALLPGTLSPFSATVVALVFLLEVGWYLVVALVLSSRAPRAAYLARKKAIDRTAAVIMALLGVRLLVAAARAI